VTAELQRKKDFFQLSGGLNTEINELNFPDGYTTDETNYEILKDGSRRRRKGLAEETSGVDLLVGAHRTAGYNQTYVWKNVGGDPSKTVVVYRKEKELYFCDIGNVLSSGWASAGVSIESYETTGATSALVDDAPVSFAQGRGRLLITGQYIFPFYVEWSGTAYSTKAINILVRDYADIEDGVPIGQETTSTATADHRYNLRNRGWKQDDMDTYFTNKSKNPSKNALWWRGYERTYGTSINPEDGVKGWNSDKLEAEAFGGSSAPKGSLLLNPHDTTYGQANTTTSDPVEITTWSVANANVTPWVITLTTAATHTISVSDEFTISGNLFEYTSYSTKRGNWDSERSFDGIQTATAVTGTTIEFTYSQAPTLWTAWVSQFKQLGAVDGDAPLARSSGTTFDDSFNAIEFFAGRGWYAGMGNTEWADTIFYSQIVDNPSKLGRCHQEADPTDDNFNAPTTSDGGFIVLPGLSQVRDIVTLKNSLLIFSDEGVWEVGGSRGVFTALDFNVRKITDEGCGSGASIIVIENSVAYTGPGGIFIIAPNQYTSVLEAQSASQNTIQTFWNQIPDAQQSKLQTFHDSATRKVYFMYGATATAKDYTNMLVFDIDSAGWAHYSFGATGLLTGVALPSGDDSDLNKRMKFFYTLASTSTKVADFNQTDFNDWDGAESPLPYMVTGHDNLGDWQRKRQAPVITVYSKRTETGYTAAGDGWDAVNASSTLLTPYWDWTDDAVTNKIGSQQEVYRHKRNFVPSAADDVDGYPVVVTRSKVRGRGRALQLRFDGAAAKDSHLLGFTTNYKITRKV
jgi:hypothetical protein